MNITSELERLARLHQQGALTAEEFAQAKNKLLAAPAPPEPREPVEPDRSLGEAANRYVSFQQVMAVIGFILFVIFFFTIILPAMRNTRPF